jgi:hypothetical protein
VPALAGPLMQLLAHDVDYCFNAGVELCDMTADIKAFGVQKASLLVRPTGSYN